MITISDGILTIPEGERFVGFTGDNLHSQKKFFIRSAPQSGWLYRLYLTFDDGRHNFFTLPATVSEEGTWLTWDIEESHIFKSGLVKAQIKAFSNEKEVYHTTSDVFVAGLSTEEDEEFKNSNSEFLHFEKNLNDLYAKMQTASAKMPYVGTNGNWFTYDVSSEAYVDSGVSSLVSVGDGTLSPEKFDRAYWEKFTGYSQITDCAVLFDTVGFTNTGGSIAFVNVNIYVAALDTTINGYCIAVGVKTNKETVYLIDLTDGTQWKINRTNTGDDLVPVYTYDFIRQTADTDDIADGAVADEKLQSTYWKTYDGIPTIVDDSHFASMLDSNYIGLVFLGSYVSIYNTVGVGPFFIVPMDNDDKYYALFSLATTVLWSVDKSALSVVYRKLGQLVYGVDDELSESSTNLVQNRLVTAAINKRLKTAVYTVYSADTDIIASLTDDNYIGIVRGATEDIPAYKFESWRDSIALTVTQYRTFLSTNVKEKRQGVLTDGACAWESWAVDDTAAASDDNKWDYYNETIYTFDDLDFVLRDLIKSSVAIAQRTFVRFTVPANCEIAEKIDAGLYTGFMDIEYIDETPVVIITHQNSGKMWKYACSSGEFEQINNLFTEEDKAETVESVLAALPTWNGGSY